MVNIMDALRKSLKAEGPATQRTTKATPKTGEQARLARRFKKTVTAASSPLADFCNKICQMQTS